MGSAIWTALLVVALVAFFVCLCIEFKEDEEE